MDDLSYLYGWQRRADIIIEFCPCYSGYCRITQWEPPRKPEFWVDESDKGYDKNIINLILYSGSWVKEKRNDFPKVCGRGVNWNQTSQALVSIYYNASIVVNRHVPLKDQGPFLPDELYACTVKFPPDPCGPSTEKWLHHKGVALLFACLIRLALGDAAFIVL